MNLQFNLEVLEVEGMPETNENRLQTAVSDALQRLLLKNEELFQLTTQQLSWNEINVQIDGNGSLQNCAEQIAKEIIRQVSKLSRTKLEI
jgi:hypothetical protein